MKKKRRGIWRHAVRNHGLFEQPDEEDREPDGDILQVQAIGSRLLELRHHLLVMQDGAGDQMWKVGDKQPVMDRVVFRRVPAMDVGEKRDLREGEK